jgi:hypothetical protein
LALFANLVEWLVVSSDGKHLPLHDLFSPRGMMNHYLTEYALRECDGSRPAAMNPRIDLLRLQPRSITD